MPARTRFKYRVCGTILPAWFPVAKTSNGAMPLHHLSQQHLKEAKA